MKTENQPQPLPDNAESASLDDFKEYLDNSKKLNKEPLTSSEILLAKTNALTMSRNINPNVRTTSGQGTLGYIPNEIAPSTEKLLKDAQTIYNWLIS